MTPHTSRDVNIDFDQLVTPQDAARFFNTTVAALSQRRHLGRGPAFVKQGRRVKYRFGDLVAELGPVASEGRADSMDPLLTAAEVAAWQSSTEDALSQMRFRGTGPTFVVLGTRSIRNRRGDLDEYLRVRTRGEDWKG